MTDTSDTRTVTIPYAVAIDIETLIRTVNAQRVSGPFIQPSPEWYRLVDRLVRALPLVVDSLEGED